MAIIFNDKLLLLYERNIDNAKFVGNLSRAYWQGLKVIHITEEKMLANIESFIEPIFQKISLNYAGADIVMDKHGKLWLLELNSMPHYDSFVRDNGEKIMVEMVKKILKSLIAVG
ncbi:MAG: hypothetical protein F6K14_33740 [Symploca sp. SIO2C1]|nr:hypothetical protein [Symploca sp. SIO2C1]